MPMPSPRTRRRAALIAAAVCAGGAVAAAAGSGLVACILADPPAALPAEPPRRPTILHPSVAPSTTTILRTWPREFVIPVEVASDATFEWSAFLDYDPSARGEPIAAAQPVAPDPGSEDGGIRTFSVELPLRDPSACHTVEIIVALSFAEPHTPNPPGGDSVVWFYSPTGDLSTCPVFDAGAIDGALPASDGGVVIGPQDAAE